MGVVAGVMLQRDGLGLPLSLWAAPVGGTGLCSLVVRRAGLCLCRSRGRSVCTTVCTRAGACCGCRCGAAAGRGLCPGGRSMGEVVLAGREGGEWVGGG